MELINTTNCLNLIGEIGVFALVESFTRNIFPGRGCSKAVLLSSQLAFLVFFGVMILLHHPPYLLLLSTFAVLCALLWNLRSVQENKYLSKPLPNATSGKSSRNHSTEYYKQVDYPLESHGSGYRFSSTTPINTPTKQLHKPPDSLNRRLLSSHIPKISPSKRPLALSSQKLTNSLLPKKMTGFFTFTNFSPLNKIGSIFDYERNHNPYPPGFINSGNTCFVNSSLQCLIWMPGFVENLSQSKNLSAENSHILNELTELMLSVYEHSREPRRHQSIDMTSVLQLLSSVAPHLFCDRVESFYQSQQDCAEFLLWLLNFIHTCTESNSLKFVSEANSSLEQTKQRFMTEINQMKSTDQQLSTKLTMYSDVEWSLYINRSKSFIYEQFLGQLLEARECQLCSKVSLNIEYFMVLPLPLPTPSQSKKVFSLEDCFGRFSEIEELTNTNMITCSCIIPNEQSLTPAKRRSLVSKLPKNLIIQLSRYSYQTNLQTTMKNNVCVKLDTMLNLPSSIESQLGSTSCDNVVYKLTSVCVHSGAENTSNGHYVAYCDTPNGWCYFNDESVKKVPDIEEELQSYFVLQNAYVLFYASQ